MLQSIHQEVCSPVSNHSKFGTSHVNINCLTRNPLFSDFTAPHGDHTPDAAFVGGAVLAMALLFNDNCLHRANNSWVTEGMTQVS